MELKEYLKPREVYEKLGISPNTLYRMIHDGTMPAVKLGRKLFLIPADEFEEYLNNNHNRDNGGDDVGT